jgi:hypothetical protein
LPKPGEFDRAAFCKRTVDGRRVECVRYSDALYHEMKNCPRENCYEYPPAEVERSWVRGIDTSVEARIR